MRFQLPGNSRVHIRLFEKVEVVGSECHRLFDILGVETEDGSIDAICHAHASRFHKTRPVEDIKKAVDEANKPDADKKDATPEESEGEQPEAKAEDTTPLSETDVVPEDNNGEAQSDDDSVKG